MKPNSWQSALLLSSMALAAESGYGAEIKLNGFASFVGGKAFNGQRLPNGTLSSYLADPVHALVAGTINDDARYSDELSFRPDSIYGLQVNAFLGQGLRATAQLTGKGANDFETEIEWAYLSYDVTESTTLQAGRQRIPLYFYSDFLDVGYAYHWIRPPVEVYGSTMSTYEGFSIMHNGALGNWDTSTRLYSGAIISEESRFGEFGSDEMVGLVFSTSNEWLRLRASGVRGKFFVENSTTNSDNAVDAYFSSLAGYVTLGDGFLAAETTYADTIDDYIDTIGSVIQSRCPGRCKWTVDLRKGHISYAEVDINYSGFLNPSFKDLSNVTETTTVGVRWDFHPAAAFKLEYSTSTDASSREIISAFGKRNEVDAVSFGFDIIF
ncbi:MAG: hypothetical protein P8Y45_03045 [Exilibacterium sp.]